MASCCIGVGVIYPKAAQASHKDSIMPRSRKDLGVAPSVSAAAADSSIGDGSLESLPFSVDFAGDSLNFFDETFVGSCELPSSFLFLVDDISDFLESLARNDTTED